MREKNVRHQRQFLLSTTVGYLICMIIVALVLQGNLLRSLPVSVTSLADHGPGSLRDAIARASDGDTISFASTLKGGTILLTSGELQITKNLIVSGSSKGFLSISGGGRSRIFHIGTSTTVTLSNLIIEDGYADDGGGILNEGMLALNNSTVSDNRANRNGGGIENKGGAPELLLAQNSISKCGLSGGSCTHRPPTPTTVAVVDNGSMAGTLLLKNSVVAGNRARFGGGIDNDGLLLLTDSLIAHNAASDAGGGINNFGLLTLGGSTISGNTAFSGGAGINNFKTLTIDKSTISGNGAEGSGGGIQDSGESLKLTNSTLSGNNVKDGGGGLITSGDKHVSIAFCTIYGNSARVGGGLFNTDTDAGGGDSTVVMAASMIAGDKADSGPDVSGTVVLLYPNLIQTIAGASIVFGTDPSDTNAAALARKSIFGRSPLVGPLSTNGGLTLTHPLLADSPAIDQIPLVPQASLGPFDNYAATICHSRTCSTDQRGVARPQGLGFDLGAYELVY